MSITRRQVLAAAIGGAVANFGAFGAERRWIDVHMHIVGGPQRQFGQAVDLAVAQMDAVGIAKAIVLPPPLPKPVFDYPAYVSELKRYPGRFGFLGGGGFLNSMLHRFSKPETVTAEVHQRFIDIAENVADAGAAGFGEIALLHLSLTRNHPFEQATPEHPLMLALMEVAGRKGKVIDLHMDAVVANGAMRAPTGLRIPPNPSALMGNIAGFERLLAHDRNARIVWAHGGSDFTGDMTPALIHRLMDAHSNLYMSLRPITPGMTFAPALGLKIRNTIMTERGISEAWLDLLKRHSNRFVLGGDTFFLAASVLPDNPLQTLSRGNQMRLRAAGQLVSRLPAELGKKIAKDNAARLYKV